MPSTSPRQYQLVIRLMLIYADCTENHTPRILLYFAQDEARI